MSVGREDGLLWADFPQLMLDKTVGVERITKFHPERTARQADIQSPSSSVETDSWLDPFASFSWGTFLMCLGRIGSCPTSGRSLAATNGVRRTNHPGELTRTVPSMLSNDRTGVNLAELTQNSTDLQLRQNTTMIGPADRLLRGVHSQHVRLGASCPFGISTIFVVGRSVDLWTHR